ncbi:MAG: pitrilysin family protein [Actinomycetota bacterium]
MADQRRLTTTPEGLRVVTEPLAGVRSIALGVWIGVGSRFESPAEAGISHFIEHMLFKGTPRHTAEEIAQIFDGLGGEVNAATSKDYTVVYTRVLDEHLDVAFPVMTDMVVSPSWADLEQEREVVLEEIAMYEDDPHDRVHDLISEAVFPRQALGRPVIGFAEVVGGVGVTDVRAYHGGHYVAQNMVVAAAGNVDHDRLVELCRTHLGALPQGPVRDHFEPAAPGEPVLVVREKPTEQCHLALGGPSFDRNDPRRHAQSVLDTILGGSMSSRLFQEVREKRGLAYSVGSYAVGYADSGQVGVYVGTREDNLGTACEVIARELGRLVEEPVGDAELSRAKEHLKGRLVLGLESPATRMHRIGKAVLSRTELLEIDEVIARIDAVSAGDVQRLADEYWRPDRMSAAAIGPREEPIRRAVALLSPQLEVGA